MEIVFRKVTRTASVADLRNNFRRLASWVSDGESVAIHKRGKLFATLVPRGETMVSRMPEIEFARQSKEVWGVRMFSDEEVAAMRSAEIDGEGG